MARIMRLETVILSLVVLTTGVSLRISHAEEAQSQVQPEEGQGQVQERAVPALPGLQPGTSFAGHSSPPPPTTATAAAWANWLNGYGPQAVPEETIVLGTFNGMGSPYPNRVVWSTDLPRKGISPACQHSPSQGGGGLVLTSESAPVVKINSFNERYRINLPSEGNIAGLRVVLTVPTLNGSEDYPGVIEEIAPLSTEKRLGDPGLLKSRPVVSIAFHPRTFRPQILKFLNSSGTVVDCYKIIPYLQPQLGAFVVPYIPVAIIYQPPGCLVSTATTPCPLGGTACGSTAQWKVNSKIGTTLSVGTKSTSGSVQTQSSSDYFNDVSAFFQVAQGAASVIPGGQAAASAFGYISQATGAIQQLWNVQNQITTTQTQGKTASKGWSIELGSGYGTTPCGSDVFVFLRDVLFVYTVVLKDPFSGMVSATGESTVILAPMKWNGPIAVPASDLPSMLPAEIVDQFRALNLKMNPPLLTQKISGGPIQSLRFRRLVPYPGSNAEWPNCPTEIQAYVTASLEQFTAEDISQETTSTTVTNVSGFLASMSGKDGTTTQSMTYSSNVSIRQSVSQDSGLTLYCPEYPPPTFALKVDVYYDTLFGTLLGLPGAPLSAQPEIGGMAPSNSQVVLNIGGKTYRVVSDVNGNFAFRSRSIPTGSGTIIVGGKTFPIVYAGKPVTALDLRR